MRTRLAGKVVSVLTCALAPVVAHAQNWTGTLGSSWNNGNNWGGGLVPTSAAATVLTFGSASTYTSNNNLANPFLLNRMTFAASAGQPYSMTGSMLDFRASAGQPSIEQHSSHAVQIANNIEIGALE